MKKIFLVLSILLIAALSVGRASAQTTLHGVCVNDKGERISYVNIKVSGAAVGTLSDAQGNFYISIPDEFRDSTLVFAHLSYDHYSESISSLSQRAQGNPLRIEMTPYAFGLEEVVVVPPKTRLAILNPLQGKLMNNQRFDIYQKNPDKYGGRILGIKITPENFDDSNNEYRFLGTVLYLEKEAIIKSVEFEISRTTFDLLIMRICIYGKTDDGFRPLMREPHMFNIEKSNRRQMIDQNLLKYNIKARGEVYVGVEIVETSAAGRMTFPLYGDVNLYLLDVVEGVIGSNGEGGTGPRFLVNGYILK